MNAPAYLGCVTGDCRHKNQAECFDEIYTLGYSDAVAKVRPALRIAFEDTCDRYYKNLEEALDRALRVE